MDEPRFCTKCGHEISVGAEFCAYCGTRVSGNTDPVSAGARYERYEENSPDIEGKAKWEGNVPQAITAETNYRCMVCGYIHHGINPPNQCPQCRAGADKIIPVKPQAFNATISCYKCGSMIPADSKYCPVCQVQLFLDCPKCGHRYSAQYHNCNQCGTNREDYLKAQELAAVAKQLEEKKKKEEEELQRRRQEEALRQVEREKRRREEQTRIEREQYEERKRREEKSRQLEAQARQWPKEVAWIEHYVENNKAQICQLCNSWQSQNESNSKKNYTKMGLSIVFGGLLITMILAISLDSICPSGEHILPLIGGYIILLIIGVVISNRKVQPQIQLRHAVKKHLNDFYYQDTKQRFLYITDVDISRILEQNRLFIRDNKLINTF